VPFSYAERLHVERPPISRPGLTRDAFEELLRQLDADPKRAGDLYNRHRQRLVQYFAWTQCADAEALADEVMDRVARRLSEGEVVPRLGAYFLGVARLVVLEQRQRAEQRRRALVEYDRQRVADPPHEIRERRAALDCLERCLDRLSPDRRALILDYYAGPADRRIAKRQELAETLGLHAGALRNRALRLRQSLEICVAECRRHADHRDGRRDFTTSDQRGVDSGDER
jgi:RNA polymerase sigma factor (sigma-70 family)